MTTTPPYVTWPTVRHRIIVAEAREERACAQWAADFIAARHQRAAGARYRYHYSDHQAAAQAAAARRADLFARTTGHTPRTSIVYALAGLENEAASGRTYSDPSDPRRRTR